MSKKDAISWYFKSVALVAITSATGIAIAFALESFWVLAGSLALFVVFVVPWLLLLPLVIYLKRGGTLKEGASMTVRGGVVTLKGASKIVAAVAPFAVSLLANSSEPEEDHNDASPYSDVMSSRGIKGDLPEYYDF